MPLRVRAWILGVGVAAIVPLPILLIYAPPDGQQRAERNRAKQAKKEAKLREQEEETARRKAEREQPGAEPPKPDEDDPA